MYIKINKDNKIVEFCSNKINDSFVFIDNDDFDFRNYNYYLKNGKIEKEERDKEDLKKLTRICFLQSRLNELSQDFIQVSIGAKIDNIETRKQEFVSCHNELRNLLGKEKREYEN